MMKVNIKTTNIELSPSINEYVDKKLDALGKLLEDGADALVQVEIGKTSRHHKSGDVFLAEVRLNHNGKDFYASVEKDDLYAAIDEVKDEIVTEVSRDKKKAQKLWRIGALRVKNLLRMIKLK